MARRPEQKSEAREVAIVVTASTAVLGVFCLAVADGDLGEAVGRFSVLGGLMGLLVVFSLWEKRARGRAYQDCWRRVCHVLEGDHSHEGLELTGTWKGRPFRAFANLYYGGQYVGTVREYWVSMPAEQSGPGWKAERANPSRGSRGSQLWTIRADAPNTEGRLVRAGLLAAIEESERSAVHIRFGVRLTFYRKMGEVAYQDRSGEAPCADDLVVHLDLVRRAVDVHAAAMAPVTGPEGERSA